MARIFTLNRFEESSEESYVVVNVPALENTGNTELERRVNYEIALKINEQVAEAKQLSLIHIWAGRPADGRH